MTDFTAPLSMAPAPSLVGQLYDMVEETTKSARDSLLQLDDISNWDANEINHGELLQSVETIKGQLKDWRQAFINKLRTMWLEQTKEYNDYKRKVESTLKIRHCSELDVAFPQLRDTATDIDLSGCSPYDEETKFKQHLFQLGFKFDGESRRLQGLCRRQLHEATVFAKLTLAHSERLLHAKQADEQKLQALIQKPQEQLELLVQAVEKKISASNRAASYTVYRRPKQASGQRGPGSAASGANNTGEADPRTSLSQGKTHGSQRDLQPSSARSASMSQSQIHHSNQPISQQNEYGIGNDMNNTSSLSMTQDD